MLMDVKTVLETNHVCCMVLVSDQQLLQESLTNNYNCQDRSNYVKRKHASTIVAWPRPALEHTCTIRSPLSSRRRSLSYITGFRELSGPKWRQLSTIASRPAWCCPWYVGAVRESTYFIGTCAIGMGVHAMQSSEGANSFASDFGPHPRRLLTNMTMTKQTIDRASTGRTRRWWKVLRRRLSAERAPAARLAAVVGRKMAMRAVRSKKPSERRRGASHLQRV